MVVLIGILCTILLDILLTIMMHEVAILGYATVIIWLFFFGCNFGFSSPEPESIVQNIVVQKRICEFYTRNALYFNFFGVVALGGVIAFGLIQFSQRQISKSRAGLGACHEAGTSASGDSHESEATSTESQQELTRLKQDQSRRMVGEVEVEDVPPDKDKDEENDSSNRLPPPGQFLWPANDNYPYDGRPVGGGGEPLVGGGGGKLKKQRKTNQSMLTQSGLTEEQEFQTVLSISKQNDTNSSKSNSNCINDIDGDLMESMSTNELYDNSYDAFLNAQKNGKVKVHQFTNQQDSNSCTSVATYSAARHVSVRGESLSTSTSHFGISMGLKMYKEAICVGKEKFGDFIGLGTNNDFINRDGIEIESTEQENFFDKQSRRDLLEKLNQGGRKVGIGEILFLLFVALFL